MGRKKLPLSAFAMHEKRAIKIRNFITSYMAGLGVKKVGILLSAGVDSHVCLFGALHAGLEVRTYSFRLGDRESTDFKIARQTAKTFQLPFTEVVLPTDTDSMQQYLLDLYNKYNTREIHINKSSAECLWALYAAIDQSAKDGNEATVIGLGGDTFFCMLRSQKKRLHEYEKVKEEYHTNVVKNKGDVQTIMMECFLEQNHPEHKIITPFHTTEMFSIMKGMHPFDEGCKPIQKAPMRLAFFSSFQLADVRVHQSFQKGDSGISDHFQNTLIVSGWNKRNLKSVKGIYNDLESGVIRKTDAQVARRAAKHRSISGK